MACREVACLQDAQYRPVRYDLKGFERMPWVSQWSAILMVA